MDNEKTSFGTALRSLLIFQLKLAADALRDLLMSPVSIIMFVLDVVLQPAHKDSHYQQLMAFGRKTDHWINLFEEYPPQILPQDQVSNHKES
ncbi:MAG: hypothetical protein RQ757_00125 [Pseudomonadales bacterium]|nr:hypothetical protein [Pseudomonadales bacterium]